MRGISIRMWIVGATAAAASVMAHWHPWAPDRPCRVSRDFCDQVASDAPELTWWWAFAVILPIGWWAVVRVRRWFLLWTLGLALAVPLQIAMTVAAGHVGGGRVSHTVIESTLLALLYGTVCALSELISARPLDEEKRDCQRGSPLINRPAAIAPRRGDPEK